VAEKPCGAAVNFDTSRNLQRHRAVLTVLARRLVFTRFLVEHCAVLGLSLDHLTQLFKFSVKWDYVFEYKMDQSKSFAAVAEGIYNEIVQRTKVFVYIIFSADTATALCIFMIFYK